MANHKSAVKRSTQNRLRKSINEIGINFGTRIGYFGASIRWAIKSVIKW